MVSDPKNNVISTFRKFELG